LPSTGPTGPPTLPFEGKDAPNSHRELRKKQLQPRQEACTQKDGTADPAAKAEQPDQGTSRLPSPQLTTEGRAPAKRKYWT
ncbi:hypothetical protein P692DRAFT_20742825, partial [Suillus brevipes Sb2]